jgi:hypothetical protein
VLARTVGVSDGFGDVFVFFFEVGESEPDWPFPAAAFFFFLPFGEVSFAGDFFSFAFAVASGVSLGVAEALDSSVVFFLAFDFGFDDGDGDFDFLRGDVLDFGVGDLSAALTACALRTGFSSSVGCA